MSMEIIPHPAGPTLPALIAGQGYVRWPEADLPFLWSVMQVHPLPAGLSQNGRERA